MKTSNRFASKWSIWLRKDSKHSWWEKFKQLLLFITVVSFSSNLFLKLSVNSAYVQGLLIDYLIPKLYLFDCLLIINLVIFFFTKKNLLILQKNKIKLNKIDLSILILLIIFLIRNFSQFDLNNFVSIIRFLLLIIFSLSIYLDKEKQKIVLNALFLTILWQSFLAYYQFIYQKSLAPYYFFGETNLQHFASISRAQFFREEKILSYGSTAHPNILAGIISIFSILFIDKKQKKKLLEILLLVNAFLICYVAQSLSAFLILVLYLIYLIIKKISKNKNTINWQKIFNLSLIIFFVFTPLIIKQINLASAKNHLSISRRVMLNTAAWQMFLDKPLFGVGLNNFVNELETYSQNPETVRFVQPVHHLGLLILSEGGLLLGLILLILVKKFYQYIDWSKLLILSPIASLDHHLITQALGLITLMLFIIFTRRRSWS